MKECFEIKENELHVNYEPVNDLDQFAKNCMKMLAENHEPSVYVVLNESVNTISSSYVGVLMSCAMLSNQMGKKFHIKCSNNLKRLIDVLDGHKLMKFMD